MLGWLKRLFGARGDENDGTVEAWVYHRDGTRKKVSMQVIGTVGLSLLCNDPNGGQRLVLPEHAADRGKFMREWRDRNGGGKGWTWEDGSPL